MTRSRLAIPSQTVTQAVVAVLSEGLQRSVRCPAHDDKHASLSVAAGRDGRILLRCRAGCTFKNIVTAAGLDDLDVLASDRPLKARTTHPDVVAALDAIRWTSNPAPRPETRPVIDIAIESLPTVEDDVAADLIEQLALALEDQHDEVGALRTTLSEALSLAHQQHREIERLRRVYHAAVEELRELRRQRADA